MTYADRVGPVAAATARLPLKAWGFGESIAIEALLKSPDPSRRRAVSLLDNWSSGHLPLADSAAHVAPGVPLLMLSAERGHETVLRTRAGELAAILEGTERGRYGARIHRPDLAGWEHEVWVDCMHLDGPFLARYAEVAGDPSWSDAAADAVLSHARVLQAASGLLFHGFDDLTGRNNGIHWGRGQGWALLGLVDTAAYLPVAHTERAEIVDRSLRLLEAIARHEEDGRWHTVIDRDDTQWEASIGAFVALAVRRGFRSGIVDERFQSMASRAMDSIVQGIEDGCLLGVSGATPVGSTVESYDRQPFGVSAWGQGPALLALLTDADSRA